MSNMFGSATMNWVLFIVITYSTPNAGFELWFRLMWWGALVFGSLSTVLLIAVAIGRLIDPVGYRQTFGRRG